MYEGPTAGMGGTGMSTGGPDGAMRWSSEGRLKLVLL